MKIERLCYSLAFGVSMAGLTYVFYSAYLGRTGWDVVIFSGAMLLIALVSVWFAGRDPRANADTVLLLRSLGHSLMHPLTDYWIRKRYSWVVAHLRDLLMRPWGNRSLSVAKGDQQHCKIYWDYKAQPTEYIFEAKVPREPGVWGPGWFHIYDRRLVNGKLVPYQENGVVVTAYIYGPVKWERCGPAETGGGKE